MAPYVQINYAGKARDVSTLAHELGHAIHARLPKEHSVLTFHSALPMAETASVFAEMILNERLLHDTNEPADKTRYSRPHGGRCVRDGDASGVLCHV